MPNLKILHCLRAPVGGLFRHVRDLVIEQNRAGHDVGVICDANAEDALTAPRLDALKPHLSLGLHMIPMARQIGLGDFTAYRDVCRLAREMKAGILHGHGAKGGAYARLAADRLSSSGLDVRGIYTPHGGSLHYSPRTLQGQVFGYLERVLCRRSAAIIFESRFSQARFSERIGEPDCLSAVIPNGLTPDDFAPHHPRSDAADLLYIGEMRALKGVDTLIEAIAALHVAGDRPVTALLVGDGPDRSKFQKMVADFGLTNHVSLPGPMPASEAFQQGRNIVVPSRAESFPYVVLEAAAAGMPMIATNVGGIPEIVEGTRVELIEPDSPRQLAMAISDYLENGDAHRAIADELRASVQRRFTVEKMTTDILSLYVQATQPGRQTAPDHLSVNQS